MQERIQLLKDLQELDQDLNGTRQQHRRLESEREELESELGRVQEMVDHLQGQIDQLQGDRRELSQALDQEQDNVNKAEGRLPSIKTQKEYVAVLKEIDTAKKMNKEIQDRLEGKNREIESLSREQEEKEGELAQVKERVEGRQAEIDAELAKDSEILNERSAQRETLLEQLPIQLRKRYKLLIERRGGTAVVEARNGACTGCNMHLPPQLFNNLLSQDEIFTCPHCNRLLFVEKDH